MVTRWFWGGVLVRQFQISFVSGVVSLAHNPIAASGPFLVELGDSLLGSCYSLLFGCGGGI